jgi:hypothetical protein
VLGCGGTFKQRTVDEGLGQVAAQLTLSHVKFLRHQTGGTTRRAVALEPAGRSQVVTLLAPGQRQEESAQQKGSLGFTEGTLVRLEAVAVPVVGQLRLHRVQGGDGARIIRGQRTADGRQQQRGVNPGVGRGPLPATAGMDGVGRGMGDDLIRQGQQGGGTGR